MANFGLPLLPRIGNRPAVSDPQPLRETRNFTHADDKRVCAGGEESPYFRADYVLRAMTLPAGTHTVEWRFRAPGWTAVEGVTLAASLAILLGAVAALVYCFRKKKA